MTGYLGKKVVIAGLGLTGLSCVDFFLAQGVIPKVMDSRLRPPGLDQLPMDVECRIGDLYQPWLSQADLIIASPGIALSHPALQAASQAGAEIIGDIELFCREVTAPVVAITGSNGKSTVTSLVGEMAHCAGIRVAVGGNIGLPALRLLSHECELYVLELSSFQLETTHSLQAAAATVLNVTEDHMDRYPGGFGQYQAAKTQIYQHASVCVVNAQDAATWLPSGQSASRYLSFGIEKGDYHLLQQQQTSWLAVQQDALLDVRKMQLAGRHNYANALASLALADAVGIPRTASLQALETFRGLAHRFELVREHKGVRWVNDSKATNVGSTLAALQGLQVSGRLHLLLGGDGKSADFSPLQPYLQAENVRVYCYGRDREPLAALCPEHSSQTETLREAMQSIASQTRPGDMVLLSPACASLDQFKNFEQRGDEFTHLAGELS